MYEVWVWVGHERKHKQKVGRNQKVKKHSSDEGMHVVDPDYFIFIKHYFYINYCSNRIHNNRNKGKKDSLKV